MQRLNPFLDVGCFTELCRCNIDHDGGNVEKLDGKVKQPVLESELNGSLQSPNIPPKPMGRKLSFSAGCLFELALLVSAVVWDWLFHQPSLLALHWNLASALIGIVAAIPPFLLFLWTLSSGPPPESILALV